MNRDANYDTALVPVKEAIFGNEKNGDIYMSFNADSMDGKRLQYNAINNPDGRLADIINVPIKVKDVIVARAKMNANDEDDDGRTRYGFRTIIITDDGKSYTATSTGIYNSICTLINVFGTLHFEEGLPMIVKQVSVKKGNTLTLALM